MRDMTMAVTVRSAVQCTKKNVGEKLLIKSTDRDGACAPQNYAGAPPRAPGRGGATSGATTCFGGFSGAGFLLGEPPTLGGGLIRRPWSMISLICDPSRVSYSSNAFAIVSSLSRLAISVFFAKR